jgi:hypothetical protein
MVAIDIAPAARAFAVGVPVRVQRLRVSAADPAGLIRKLQPR